MMTVAVIAWAVAAWDGWRRWLAAREGSRSATEAKIDLLPERLEGVQRALDALGSEVQGMSNKIGLMVRK